MLPLHITLAMDVLRRFNAAHVPFDVRESHAHANAIVRDYLAQFVTPPASEVKIETVVTPEVIKYGVGVVAFEERLNGYIIRYEADTVANLLDLIEKVTAMNRANKAARDAERSAPASPAP